MNKSTRESGNTDDLKCLREIKAALYRIPKVLVDIIIGYENSINIKNKRAVVLEIPYMRYAALDDSTRWYQGKKTIQHLAERIRPENLYREPLEPSSRERAGSELRYGFDDIDSLIHSSKRLIYLRKDYARLERARICPEHKGKCEATSCPNMLQGLANLRRAKINSRSYIPLDEDIVACNRKLDTHISYDKQHTIDVYPEPKNEQMGLRHRYIR